MRIKRYSLSRFYKTDKLHNKIKFSQQIFKITSGEHRDSNAYKDLRTDDFTKYPKFKNDCYYKPNIDGEILFTNEQFSKIFSNFKK